MITISCEAVCDFCKQVVASVGPSTTIPLHRLMRDVAEKAQERGATIGIETVTCADCTPKPTTPTVWVIEGESPSGDPCLDNFEID